MHNWEVDVNEVIHTCVCIGGKLSNSIGYPRVINPNQWVDPGTFVLSNRGLAIVVRCSGGA